VRSESAWGYHLQLQRGAHLKANVTELNKWSVSVRSTQTFHDSFEKEGVRGLAMNRIVSSPMMAMIETMAS
jgi:hypothetical protein